MDVKSHHTLFRLYHFLGKRRLLRYLKVSRGHSR